MKRMCEQENSDNKISFIEEYFYLEELLYLVGGTDSWRWCSEEKVRLGQNQGEIGDWVWNNKGCS